MTPIEFNLVTLHQDIREGVLKPMLPLVALGRLAQVSKEMQKQYDPWDKEKASVIFGPEQWLKLGITVRDVPPLPPDINGILKDSCRMNPKKRVYQTHRLILKPARISIESMRWKGIKFNHVWEDIQVIANIREKKTSWLLMTCEVIPGSLNKTFDAQRALIKKHPEYRLPSVLEAVVLIKMYFKETGQYLLPGDPLTYTRCGDKRDDDMPYAVGESCHLGLNLCTWFEDAVEHVGIIAVREVA